MAQRRRAGGWETDRGGGRDAQGGSARRCWPTSTFITYSTCGSRHGVRSGRTAKVIVVRFADDIVVGFNRQADAEQFRAELTERMKSSTWSCIPRNATAGVRSACDRPAAVAWRRESRDVQLPRIYAYLRKEEEQWTVYGVAADDTEKVADEAE